MIPTLCAISDGWSALGLAPRRQQSGTFTDHEGRISKRGDVTVREALCEATASLLVRVWKVSGVA